MEQEQEEAQECLDLPDLTSGNVVEWCDRLRLAFFISILGLRIPVISLEFCSIISMIVILVSLRFMPESHEYTREDFARRIYTLLVCHVVLVVGNILYLMTQSLLVSVISLVAAIWLFVGCLILTWRFLTGVGGMYAAVHNVDVPLFLERAKLHYLIASIFVFCGAILIGLVVGLGSPQYAQSIEGQCVFPFLLLPVSWIIGWKYILVPLDQARESIRSAMPS